MHEEYDKTSLTRRKVANFGGYIDWVAQPSTFKHYPEFLFSYAYGEKEKLHILELCRQITSSEMIAAKPYYKLNSPSAGNLHPLELYVQIRGVKGIISGIYHVDASAKKFVLIQEIEDDGLERAVGLTHKFEGMICVLSCVPFRSEWKYGERAVRYCYLDAGHQSASIKAAATIYDQEMTILSDFDVDALNKLMGFKDEEFTCAVMAIGQEMLKSVNPLAKPLIHVAPTDYSDTKGYVPNLIAKAGIFKSDLFAISATKKSVLSRRSARKFDGRAMNKDDFEHIMHMLGNTSSVLNCHSVVLNAETEDAGIYVGGELKQEGVFTDKLIALLVDQQFIKNAQMVIVMTAKDFSAQNLMLAGAFAHKLYLQAEQKALGFTGIGAFYDKKMQEFLDTEDYILYVCALGK